MTPEATRVLRFLAGCPAGHSTLIEADARSVLLETGGNMLACGRLYNIDAKPIGAGVYRLSLSLANP